MSDPCEPAHRFTPSEVTQMTNAIIEVLTENPEKKYTEGELLNAAKYDPEYFRIPPAVRTNVRDHFDNTGYFVPPSVPRDQFQIFATTDPAKIFEALIHFARQSHGLDKQLLRITDFIHGSISGVSWRKANPVKAGLVEQLFRNTTRKMEDSSHVMIQIEAIMAMAAAGEPDEVLG